MPEGDTLKKIQLRLNETIVQKSIREFYSSDPAIARVDFIGHSIRAVNARGKHLLIYFSHGYVIHTHLGREGRWRIRPLSEKSKYHSKMIVAITTDSWFAVCENAPIGEVMTEWELQHHPLLSNLGPDILEPGIELESIVNNLLRAGNVELGENLLDQRICAGIGNIYKSEILFLEQLDPFQRTDNYSSKQLLSLIENTRRWMRRNIAPGIRRTHWGHRTVKWVYKRAGQHCMKCDQPIRMRRQGLQQRSTYFCAHCQNVPENQWELTSNG